MSNTTFVGGLTGLMSKMLPGFRKPIELPFEKLQPIPGITLMQRHYKDHKDITNHLISHHRRYSQIIILGHSYGASGATHIFPVLKNHRIDVRLFISLDQGLDSFFIRDKPVTRNVQEVDEYHVVYEKLGFVADYSGKHNFEDIGPWPGGHTSTFKKPKAVKMIVDRVLEVHKS